MTARRTFVNITPPDTTRPDMSHLSAPRGTHWLDKGTALCSEVDPELFFPEHGDHGAAKRAKALCDRCVLRPDCLANADGFGIWGGVTERDRQQARAAK